PTFVAAKDKEIARLSQAYVDRLRRAGVRICEGHARLADAHTIELGGERITSEYVLVATGGRPRVPEKGTYITSDDAFHLPALPKHIAIVGAGYIGIEFAHIFRGFGADVTLVHRGGRILRGFDPDLSHEVERGLTAHGVRLVTGDCIDFACDVAMAAVGRDPVSGGIGLVEAGVVLDGRGAVIVDEMSRTHAPNIYAVGDVTARVQLTPVAIREGQAVADTLFGGRPTPIDHTL